jgi:hypothetical protein
MLDTMCRNVEQTQGNTEYIAVFVVRAKGGTQLHKFFVTYLGVC